MTDKPAFQFRMAGHPEMSRAQLDALRDRIDEELFLAPQQIYRRQVPPGNTVDERTFVTIEPRTSTLDHDGYMALRDIMSDFASNELGTEVLGTVIGSPGNL